jgi:GNAT superfamily N-acetyltransferase
LTDGSLKEPLPPHFYFAMFADEIAACGMLDIEKGRIDVVFVSPKFLRHGIGWAMMRHLEIIAKECGVLTLTLDAVSFYRSLGFEGHAVGTFASPRQYRCTAFE